MVALLTGGIIYHGLGFVILQTGGLGYKVTLPDAVAAGLSGDVTLYVHEAQREDGRELFGFTTINGLELCWKLLSVPGVGPKMAQRIVYGGQSTEAVIEKITVGNVEFLSTIPGVGKKTAQKIILELQGKLVDSPRARVDQDALSALVGLGYSRPQAEAALSSLPLEASTDDKIRAALKVLGRK